MLCFHPAGLAELRRDIWRLQPELPYRAGFAMYDADDAVKVVRECMGEIARDSVIVTGAIQCVRRPSQRVQCAPNVLSSTAPRGDDLVDCSETRRTRFGPSTRAAALKRHQTSVAPPTCV